MVLIELIKVDSNNIKEKKTSSLQTLWTPTEWVMFHPWKVMKDIRSIQVSCLKDNLMLIASILIQSRRNKMKNWWCNTSTSSITIWLMLIILEASKRNNSIRTQAQVITITLRWKRLTSTKIKIMISSKDNRQWSIWIQCHQIIIIQIKKLLCPTRENFSTIQQQICLYHLDQILDQCSKQCKMNMEIEWIQEVAEEVKGQAVEAEQEEMPL